MINDLEKQMYSAAERVGVRNIHTELTGQSLCTVWTVVRPVLTTFAPIIGLFSSVAKAGIMGLIAVMDVECNKPSL